MTELTYRYCEPCETSWRYAETCWICGRNGKPVNAYVVPGSASTTFTESEAAS